MPKLKFDTEAAADYYAMGGNPSSSTLMGVLAATAEAETSVTLRGGPVSKRWPPCVPRCPGKRPVNSNGATKPSTIPKTVRETFGVRSGSSGLANDTVSTRASRAPP